MKLKDMCKVIKFEKFHATKSCLVNIDEIQMEEMVISLSTSSGMIKSNGNPSGRSRNRRTNSFDLSVNPTYVFTRASVSG